MKNNLLLIDGSALLSHCYFGNLPNDFKFCKTDEEKDKLIHKVQQSSKGEYVNGVFPMMRSIMKIMKSNHFTHLAVAWDLTRETFRKRLFADYKAHRKEIRAELKSQFALSQEVLKGMNIPCFAYMEYEADDVIGTLAENFKEECMVTILTKDQDALQLIDDTVRVWLLTSKASDMYIDLGIDTKDFPILPYGVFEYTAHYIETFYGLSSPRQIVDWKAICGDTSDNIPGVKGVGDKAVIPLLQEFGTVEEIYEYIENTSEKDAKAFFKELGIVRSPISYLLKESDTELVGKKSAILSKELATIHRSIPELQDVKLEDLKININVDGKKEIFQRLEFNSLL